MKIKDLKLNRTERSFLTFDFVDKYGKKFTIRQSSADMTDFWIFVDENTGTCDGHDLLIDKKLFKEVNKAIKIIQEFWKYEK